MAADANIQNFLPWRKELGLQKKVFSLRNKKNNLLAKLKKDHSQKLIARLDSIEEKIIDVQDVKLLDVTATEIKNIREECLPDYEDYEDVLSKIGELDKMVQESRDRIQGTTYVIDTNTLIDYPDILSKIEPQNTILLSAKVIEELNVKKQTIPAAQKALKNIRPKLLEHKNVRAVTADTSNLPVEFSRKDADNMILSIAISAKRKNPCLLTSNPQSRYHGFSRQGFINENIHTIWIDVAAPEKIDGTSRVNETEVEAVKHVLELLKKSHGFDAYMKFWDEHISDKTKRKFEKEVGIISFYGKQVALLRDVRLTAQKAGIPIRLNTVDKFQGMERNIVIVSTVRSDKRDDGNQKIVSNNDYGFAESAERLNVALSRAKRLLIVIGNKDFFYKAKSSDGKPLYKNAIDSIRKHGRIIDYEQLKNELD